LPPFIGDLLPGSDNIEVTETEQTSQVIGTPIPTLIPSTGTPEPAAVPSLTPTTTAEPTPTEAVRPWTWEQFSLFMYTPDEYAMYRNAYYGMRLLLNGYNRYDGVELLDDFPCIEQCSLEEQLVADRIIRDAFEQQNNAEFWCKWACMAEYNNFSRLNTYFNDYDFGVLKSIFGNENREPYCSQFTGEFEDFQCNTTPPYEIECVPERDLGWSESVRTQIEQEYLYTILEDGFYWLPCLSRPRPEWTIEDVNNLTDHQVCFIIANGHYQYGFPEYKPSPPTGPYRAPKLYLWYDLRMDLRAELNSVLGTSINGNPPLCPGFLEMIELPNLP
jgi:hypothetical protein